MTVQYGFPGGEYACKLCHCGYQGLHLDACALNPEPRTPPLPAYEHCPVCLRLTPVGTECGHTNLQLHKQDQDKTEKSALRALSTQEPQTRTESPSHTEAA